MPSSSFSGLFTRVLIGQIFSSDWNGTNRSRGSDSMFASQRSYGSGGRITACGRESGPHQRSSRRLLLRYFRTMEMHNLPIGALFCDNERDAAYGAVGSAIAHTRHGIQTRYKPAVSDAAQLIKGISASPLPTLGVRTTNQGISCSTRRQWVRQVVCLEAAVEEVPATAREEAVEARRVPEEEGPSVWAHPVL